MSQVYKNSGSSGPVPPTVATSYVTDSGIAIPAANVLNVLTSDTTVNDDDGIISTGSANTVTVLLTNRAKVTATTSDGGGQTQTVTIFTPLVSSAITFVVSVTGYDSANNEVAGGELVGIGRRSAGGVTVVVGTNDTFDETDSGLMASDWDIVTNGTAIQAQFVGVAGRTINWSAVLIYDQVQ